MSESDLYPIAVLIDELKHEDKKIRLNAMKSIQTIGKHPRSKLSKKNKKIIKTKTNKIICFQTIPSTVTNFLSIYIT